ncbi:bL28 family ribosomal protein [Patescibacteria group bacterium]
MSRTCEICGRGTVASASRSHSNIQTKTKKYINLQTKKIDGKKTKICTKCMKTEMKKLKK